MSIPHLVGQTCHGITTEYNPDSLTLFTYEGNYKLSSATGHARIVSIDGDLSVLLNTNMDWVDSSRNVFYGTAKFVFTTAKGSVTITWDDADFGDVEVRQC